MSNITHESAPQTEVEFALAPGTNPEPELYIRVAGNNPMHLTGHQNAGYKDVHLSNPVDYEPVLSVQGSRSVDETREFSNNPDLRAAEVAMLRGLGAIARKNGITKVSGFVGSPAELDAYREAFGSEPEYFVDALWTDELPISYDEARESLERHNQRIEAGTAEEPDDAGMFIGVDISDFQPSETDMPATKNEFDLLSPPSWNDFYVKNYPELGYTADTTEK